MCAGLGSKQSRSPRDHTSAPDGGWPCRNTHKASGTPFSTHQVAPRQTHDFGAGHTVKRHCPTFPGFGSLAARRSPRLQPSSKPCDIVKFGLSKRKGSARSVHRRIPGMRHGEMTQRVLLSKPSFLLLVPLLRAANMTLNRSEGTAPIRKRYWSTCICRRKNAGSHDDRRCTLLS